MHDPILAQLVYYFCAIIITLFISNNKVVHITLKMCAGQENTDLKRKINLLQLINLCNEGLLPTFQVWQSHLDNPAEREN